MKDCLVISDYGQCDNMWIVLAKNAKDAIQQQIIKENKDNAR